MDYQSHINKAIAYIEENLKSDIKLIDCARAAGYSEYHFIRVFKEAAKLTPADYIRKRRLTEAAKRFEDDIPISQIAFEYGFNSRENFTRAFVSEHHILPTEYKAVKNSLKLCEPLCFNFSPFSLPPAIIYLEAFSVIAYECDEDSPPNFWNKYNAKKWSKELSGGRICEDYGVCRWNPMTQKLDYYIGIRKENAIGDRSGKKEVMIDEGLYAQFTTPMTTHCNFVNTIHQAWAFINTIWLPASGYRHTGGFAFEAYVEATRSFSEKIYIPLEGTK